MESFKLEKGFFAPEKNIATRERGGILKGSLLDSQALISEDAADDSRVPEWTSHEIDKGSIEIILPQPFTVSSMKMRLRDDDESLVHSYYIQTSMDGEIWARAADHTKDLCRSWQRIVFDARPVQRIKITGTLSTVDGVSTIIIISHQYVSSAASGIPVPRWLNINDTILLDQLPESYGGGSLEV